MKNLLKKSLAVLLTLAMLCTFVSFGASAENGVLTECGGECAYAPSIVVPGLFQSQNRLYDADGNMVLDDSGKPLTQLLVNLTTKDIVHMALQAILPLTLSLVLQADIGLSKTVAKIVADVFKNNAKGTDGKHIQNVDVLRYPDSVARCSPEAQTYIYRTIPLEHYAEVAGADHLYFFTYDSFGSISDIADELYNFIQKVKTETGHDKVNLVPISQGGSIANALMERYREEMVRDLHRMVMIIPALDGSYLIGKVFNGQFTKEDSMLYRDMFPLLMDKEEDQATAYGINLALRLLPKNTAHRIIDRTVQSLVDTLLVNTTCMWALTPQSEYEELYAKYMTDGTREQVREEVEFYHRAQVNSKENILYLQSKGIKIFDLVDYDHPFYPIIPGWDTYNADGIIQVESTSCGATSSAINSTLPADYVQQNTYCTCGGNHISPDRKVDASTGALCETTFYFDEGNHERTGDNDVLIGLAIELLTDESFTDVHSYPDKYPQFNTARESKGMRNTLKEIQEIDLSTLEAADAAELTAAVAACEAVLAQTVVDLDAFKQAQERLNAILVKIGRRNPPKEMSESDIRRTEFMHKLSDWAYRVIGPRGFVDVVRLQHTKW